MCDEKSSKSFKLKIINTFYQFNTIQFINIIFNKRVDIHANTYIPTQ